MSEVLDGRLAESGAPGSVRGPRRRHAAFVRQGEWLFVPTALWPEPLATQVLRDEPLTGGRGEAHVVQFAFRRGLRTAAVRGPEVYARGAVRHPEHGTLHLRGWHRVFTST